MGIKDKIKNVDENHRQTRSSLKSTRYASTKKLRYHAGL